jgi:acetyl esterase/lipase
MKTFFAFIIALLMPMVAMGVTIEYTTATEIPYSSNTDDYSAMRCKLDVYYPVNTTDCPVVVWFHGGGLTGGEKYIPNELKESGMVIVAPNYRLMPNVEISACIDDAALAVAWTFREIEKFGGSNRKIYVAGHSAGGYLTAMIGLDKTWLNRYGIDADSIAGLIPFSGQMITHFAHRDMHGIGNLQPTVDEYAPLFHVRKDVPTMLLITGDREQELFGRYEENAYMARMMKLVGNSDISLFEIGGHDHGAMVSPSFHILKDFINSHLK